MQEVENILRIFEETKQAIEKNDLMKIKSLSNQTINTASLTHDPDNSTVAVIIYSLSKILQREGYRSLPGWNNFHKIYINSINSMIIALQKKDEKVIQTNLNIMRNAIGKVSGQLKNYIQDVFRKASINKASRIYEHGISMEKTASLLGITLFELANYTGQRDIESITPIKPIDLKSRVKIAMEIFG